MDDVAPALSGITVGDELLVLTWLHQGDRSTLTTRPRNDPTRPETGVFATRSPDRPNPLGLHRVTVLAVDGTRLHVSGLEAIDGTPVVDLKPVLGAVDVSVPRLPAGEGGSVAAEGEHGQGDEGFG